MKILKISFLLILGVLLCANLAYADKDDKGDNSDKGKGKDKETIVITENKDHPAHPQSLGQENRRQGNQGRRNAIKKQQEELTIRTQESEPQPSKSYDNRKAEGIVGEENEIIIKNLAEALEKLEHARWSYNPNDQRGQGNMGNVLMLAPYGHDKDSDRKELYGNRGRVIRVPEPVPEPPPAPEEPPVPEPPPAPEEPPAPETPPPAPELPPDQPAPQPPF